MADRQWTAEQKQAIMAESGTLLVSAAAGSGKTSVLVERIVRKLTDAEKPVPPESLLVVTFTNAAAAEMRSRIYDRLLKKAAEEPSRRREYALLQVKLDEMKICTMDAFCMNFVRENFHAAQVEADFRILDNGESDILKKRVSLEVIERLYTEDEENFLPLTALFDKGRSDDALAEGIIRLSDFSGSEPDPAYWLEGIAQHFADVPPEESVFGQIIAEDVAEGLDYCVDLIASAVRDAEYDEALYAKFGPILENDRTLLTELRDGFAEMTWNERREALERTLSFMKAKRMLAPKGYTEEPHKVASSLKRDEIKDSLKKFIAKMCVTSDEHREDIERLCPAACELIKAVVLFRETLLAYKREMNAYDFSDILHFTLGLLSDREAADGKTELAREMSGKFSEILIDEYQDTNRAQEYLFTALSRGGGNMFTVGDVKQSIYRFRLASPELFIEKCEAYPPYDGISPKSKIILGQNFRSRRGITDAVNFVFSSLLSRKCGEIEYNEDEMLYCGASYPETDEPETELVVLADEAVTGVQAEAQYTAGLIMKKLQSGAQVFDHGAYRNAVPGDFCILVRSSKGVAPVFAWELRKVGLSVSLDSREGFFEAAEIRILLSFLRVIDNPARDVDLLAAMMSPLFGFSADDCARVKLFAKRNQIKKGSLYSAATAFAAAGDEKCLYLTDKIRYYQKIAAVSAVDELLRAILTDTSFLSVCSAMENGNLRKNNVFRLLEYAEKGTSESSRTLAGFIRYTDMLIENGTNLTGAVQSADKNSVAVMTMHRSKGLEFPFVIMAGTCKQFNKTDLRASLVISHKNGIGLKILEKENIRSYETLSSAAIRSELLCSSMSEELRICYVAMTRAKEKLFIVMSPAHAQKKLEELGYLLPDRAAVPAYMIKNASAPYEWLLMSFLAHPDASALRLTGTRITDTPSRAKISLIETVEPFTPPEEEKIEDIPADPALTRQIRNKAGFVYPYARVASALSKHTASKVNEERFSEDYFARTAPAFMYGEKLSPADIGTATHKFMQYCDFEKCAEDTAGELARLVSSCRLTQTEAEYVDTGSVHAFVTSGLMNRCKNAQQIYREKQFTIAKSICEMDETIPEEFRGEKTVVIGKIDMVFIENGAAVIVDYKTDDITDVSVLRKRYSEQLRLYAEAVHKTMGLTVSECVLYSLKLREFCTVDPELQ